MSKRATIALITYVDWHGDVVVISRHSSIRAAERAFTFAINHACYLGLRLGQRITLAIDGRADVVGTAVWGPG